MALSLTPDKDGVTRVLIVYPCVWVFAHTVSQFMCGVRLFLYRDFDEDTFFTEKKLNSVDKVPHCVSVICEITSLYIQVIWGEQT